MDHDEWKWDEIPQIMDGHNIADFIDPNIEERLAQLEAEEAEYERQLENGMVGAASSRLGSRGLFLMFVSIRIFPMRNQISTKSSSNL